MKYYLKPFYGEFYEASAGVFRYRARIGNPGAATLIDPSLLAVGDYVPSKSSWNGAPATKSLKHFATLANDFPQSITPPPPIGSNFGDLVDFPLSLAGIDFSVDTLAATNVPVVSSIGFDIQDGATEAAIGSHSLNPTPPKIASVVSSSTDMRWSSSDVVEWKIWKTVDGGHTVNGQTMNDSAAKIALVLEGYALDYSHIAVRKYNAGATVDGQTFDVATWVYHYTEDFQNGTWFKTDAVKLYATLTSL